MISTAQALPELLRTLVDPTRLRILGLLEHGELSVGELARALDMQQSRVSNQLRVLRDARLLEERHVGRTTYLRVSVAPAGDGDGPPLAARLWNALRPEIASLPEFSADLARLARVRDERAAKSAEFFDRVAREWDKIGGDFASGEARQRAVASLLPRDCVLADLGCGTGYVARALLPLCRKLVCVDRSAAMLDEARRKLEPLPAGLELDLREGDLHRLPIADGELDGCIAAMVLHHVENLSAPLAEMHRALKDRGRAVVVELAPHREEWMRQEQSDRHLGLEPRDVLAAFERAGFESVQVEPLDDRYQPTKPDAAPDGTREKASLPLYLVRGVRPQRA